MRSKINDMSVNKNNIISKATAPFEQYLNDLYELAVTTKATLSQSIEEILYAYAIDHGRAVEEAKQDVQLILNMRSSVKVLLHKAAEKCKPMDS